jgi:hypothetical protein
MTETRFARVVLLANFNPACPEALEITLRTCRYRVVVPEAEGISLDDITDNELRQVDYVVFNLTHLTNLAWSRFERICRIRRDDGMPLMVIGWSRRFHGAKFHDDVEMLGAKMEYAK